MRSPFIACVLLLGLAPSDAAVVCATLPTLEACIKCGAKKYGYEVQVRHCQANWRPVQKAEHISRKEMIRRYGK